MINYALKIKEYRERRCLTQKELANILCVSILSIIRWEKGQFEPTMQVKKKLMELFKKERMNLFESDGKKND